jgi:enolase-phosphatase E1
VIKAIVTDIEGTTSDITFVKDVLFPYARQHLPAFVTQYANTMSVKEILDAVRAHEENPAMSIPDCITCMIDWIDRDQKITPLKSLQGLIWEAGYKNGDFTGHIFADANDRLRQWHAANIKLYVYSSGSVHAQKLLFGHSDAGDLTPLFTGYFDTTTGSKQEKLSYAKITTVLGLPPAEILFLSDIIAELDAARDAGMQTTALNRDGFILDSNHHQVVKNFKEIAL